MPAHLVNRGELWSVDFPDFGPHPAVVVSRQVSIPVRTDLTVVLVTTTVRGSPAEVPLNSRAGLDHPSVANCDQIHTVPKSALVSKVGDLGFEDIRRIDAALRISLDLP